MEPDKIWATFELLRVTDVIVLILLFGCFFFASFREESNKIFPKNWVYLLMAWHLIITIISYIFNLNEGKEVLIYWRPIIYTYDLWIDWRAHWGFNTYFMESLNYFPGRIFDLHFFTGSIFYSMISFFGFMAVARLFLPVYQEFKANISHFHTFFLIGFLLPSLHFWTSMPSKESVIWGGLAFAFFGFSKKNWIIFLVSLAVLILIRPVFGLIVGFGFVIYFILESNTSFITKLSVFFIGSLVSWRLIQMIKILMDVESLTWASIQLFSRNQYVFLSQSQGDTTISMENSNLLEKLGAVLFRPGFWEVSNIWQFGAAIENILVLLLFPGIIGLFLFYKNGSFSKEWIFAFLISLTYCLIISLSTNNLGIMTRVRSSVLLPLLFSGYYGWFLVFQNWKSVYLR